MESQCEMDLKNVQTYILMKIQNYLSFLPILFPIIVVFTLSGMVTDDKSTLKGNVVDAINSLPVSEVEVSLWLNSKFKHKVITTGSGKFEFSGVEPGSYDVHASKPGYKTKILKSVALDAAQTKNISIAMIKAVQEVSEITPPNKSEKKQSVVMDAVSEEYEYSSAPQSILSITAEEFNTEQYDYLPENEFKDALREPLSTFSIDVDRASYANMRRHLMSGTLPPIDAVRIEELINYFDYEYQGPSKNEPFNLHTEVAECPWNNDHKLLKVGLQAQTMDDQLMPPSNLTFLIDVSGSMQQANKLPLLKRAMEMLVENLRPQDKVAIVVYAGAAGLVLESTYGNNKLAIKEAINNLRAGGSTAGGAGIKLAYRVATENYIRNGNNRIILATDGDFNVGASSDGELVRLIESKRETGVYLTVLGFGNGNLKDSRMEKLADNGNGNYAYIDNIMEARKVLIKELGGTLYTLANDVKIQIEFNPAHIKSYKLIGYENRMLQAQDFNDDKKDAGEIGSGHTVTALYELVPQEAEDVTMPIDELKYQTSKINQKGNELLTLKVRYKIPGQTTSKLMIKEVSDSNRKFENATQNFRFAVSVAMFGMVLRRSDHKGSSSYVSIVKIARGSKGEDKEGYRSEFIRLVELASDLDNYKLSQQQK